MKISRHRAKRQLFLSQTDYIERVLERFNMQLAKSASTPLPINLRLSPRDCPISGPEGEDMKSVPYALAVASPMYAIFATRLDISHVVGVISRFINNPGRSHWNVVKHVFRYLASTKDHGILFGPNSTSGVVGYTESDFVGCVDSRKSTTGYWSNLVEVETSGVHNHLNDRNGICSCVRLGKRRFMAHSIGAHVSTSQLRLSSSFL